MSVISVRAFHLELSTSAYCRNCNAVCYDASLVCHVEEHTMNAVLSSLTFTCQEKQYLIIQTCCPFCFVQTLITKLIKSELFDDI